MPELAHFNQLVDDEWETRMREDPLFATLTGDHRYNDQLGGNSEEDYNCRIEQIENFKQRLLVIDPKDFEQNDKLNYEIFSRYLKNRSEEHTSELQSH